MNRSLARKFLFILFMYALHLPLPAKNMYPTQISQNSAEAFINGRIYRGFDLGFAQAFLVQNGRFVAVGSTKDILDKMPAHTKVHDLKNQMVLPGFIESHGHLLGIGTKKMQLDVTGTKSPDEIAQKLKEWIKKHPDEMVVKGRGWDQNDWAVSLFPTHHVLSRIAPSKLVYLKRVDGHAAWVNERALKLAGITAQTPDPAGGKIVRDIEGQPTGILIDGAMDLVLQKIPKATLKEQEKALQLAMAEASSMGVTTFVDAGVGQADLDLYRKWAQDKKLNLRIYAMIQGDDPIVLKDCLEKGPQSNLFDGFLNIRSIKLFADGALGSRGAALLSAYEDDPQNLGLLLHSKDDLKTITQKALEKGFQVATHAIGDRANKLVLDVYAQALKEVKPKQPPRLRIEHAQLIEPSDVKRFRDLQVIASMQPIHCTSDMPWVPSRIGMERALKRAYIWRTLQKNQVLLAFGSDAPVESPNPLLGLYAAFTRKDPVHGPEKGFNLEETLSLPEALRAYHENAAFAAFMEHEIGQITEGFFADFVVFEKNLLELSPEKLLSERPIKTVVFGKTVFGS